MKQLNNEKSESQSNIRYDSPVKNFYKGRSVFVTGSTGFLGTVLIEKLLYTCEGVKRIYVLIKQKEGQSVKERLSKFLESGAFQRLRESNPNFIHKIKPIAGNMLEQNFGLSEEDISVLRNEVSVVFHLAANISFNMRMADAINSNTKSTGELLRICKGMVRLTAFVYISTAYSNCNKLVIDERVYKSEVPVNRVYELLQNSKQDDIFNLLLDGRPNAYTYSKALTEELIQIHSNELPAVIIRPSIILSALRDPQPGWLSSWNGIDQFIYGAITGQIRCILANPSFIVDTVPVDIVANLTIVAAWNLHVRRNNGDKMLKVFNCCSGQTNPISNGRLMTLCMDSYSKEPNSRKLKIWLPIIKYPQLFYFMSIFLHLIPAMLIDFFNLFLGGKRKLTKDMKMLSQKTQLFKHFLLNQFLFVDNNVRNLLSIMDETDKIVFDFDIRNIKWETFLQHYVIGLRNIALGKK
ncbi:hypothetical protein ACJJTC_006715 [Scirpophaga incertulas]